MTRKISRTLWIAAMAAVGVLAGQAHAQFQVDTSRANDASNRVGSAGFNDGGYYDPSYLSGRSVRTGYGLDVNPVRGNQIITGNVTGFRHFRGGVPYTDPREFRGGVGSASFDRFIADSSGVPLPGQRPMMSMEPRPFYGAALAAPPPPGFTQMGFTGAFVPTPAPPPPTGITSQLNTTLMESRLLSGQGAADLMVMPGPVDPQTQLPAVLTASPMLGVRQWDMTSPTDRAFLSSGLGGLTNLQPGRITLSPTEIQQLRMDVARAAGQLPTGQLPSGQLPGGPLGEQPTDTNLARPLPTPFDAPQSQNLTGAPQVNPQVSPQAMRNEVRPQGGMSSHLAGPLVQPAQQSSQYAELQRRMDRYYTDRLQTDEDRNREFLRQLKAREAQKQATPGTPTAPGTPTGPGTPGVPTTPPEGEPDYGRISQELLQQKPPAGGVARPEPVRIGSLATGVQAEGLKNVLNKAEELMKEGKYTSALEQYNAAGQVVPNNPLVMAGQAHAELAAGYYKRAEESLRRAFEADPVLTMAQFDLKGTVGRERLALLVSDLKETARKQANDPGPVFLLAYLAYNTGAEDQAGIYLDLAQKRAGGDDKLFRLLKMNWAIPQNTAPTPGVNK